jgi:predicted nucleic acid-binding Zn ribbon protein
MNTYLQILGLIGIGVILICLGYTLFFSGAAPAGNGFSGSGKGNKEAAAPKTCPVCSAQLLPEERVKSWAYPAGKTSDRLMNIAGCPYCLGGDRPRVCPVCGAVLNTDENLIARLFDKPGRSHVHVLGCSQCRSPYGPR